MKAWLLFPVMKNDQPCALGRNFSLPHFWIWFAVVLLATARFAQAQNNEWTWIAGNNAVPNGSISSVSGWAGVYGTSGSASAVDYPGGRSGSLTWTDTAGNLWLFGGLAYDANDILGLPNDLWEYSVSAKLWTWVGGSNVVGGYYQSGAGVYGTLGTPAKENIPSGRSGAATWSDKEGNLWLFGGLRYDSPTSYVYLNDLWEFDTAAKQWTWMGGSNAQPPSFSGFSGIYGTLGTPNSADLPGARASAATWIDSTGNLWLFGGYGADSTGTAGKMNDLWKFDPVSQQWTWVGGSTTVPANAQPLAGVYGTLGKPTAANFPGARNSGSAWISGDGQLWLFGGVGWDSEGNLGLLNDLWAFNPVSNQWAWMGGSNLTASPGQYGTLQSPAASNIPGARSSASAWADTQGNFWMLGGYGIDRNVTQALLNDLWEYSPASGTWTWMSGSSTAGINGQQSGVYGSLGTASFGDTPGAREEAPVWTDRQGNLWLLAGYGCDAANGCGYLNDLWEFQLATYGKPVATTPVLTPGTGTYTSAQTVTISDSTPGVEIYYMVNGNAPATLYTGALTVSASETISAIAGGHGYANSTVSVATFTMSLPPTAAPTFSVTAGSYATAQSVAFSDSTPGAIVYYSTGGTPTDLSTAYSGPVNVSASQTLEAIAMAPGYAPSPVTFAEYDITPTSALGDWVWVSGSDTQPACDSTEISCGNPGVYGGLGTASKSNVPGSREGAASWTDKRGNLWMFGGLGFDSVGTQGIHDDLWEFSPANDQWTWVAGNNTFDSAYGFAGIYGVQRNPSAKNYPGSRFDASTWIDSSGNFWLFGGEGFDSAGSLGMLNDLWKFDPATKLWIWVSGGNIAATDTACLAAMCGQLGVYGTLGSAAQANVPGARGEAVSWIDGSGNVWVFGGRGFDSANTYGDLNDLWEFNISSGLWTWIAGSNTLLPMTQPNVLYGEYANYGALGKAEPTNVPGGRQGGSGWIDSAGNLWLMGGWGYDQIGFYGFMNDLWKFDNSTHEWIWIGGLAQASARGFENPIYGVEGTLGTTNVPSFREGASAAVDQTHNIFWMFGGFGSGGGCFLGNENEMWAFDQVANEWTWWSGGPGTNCQGSFGIQGVASPINLPTGRAFASLWIDPAGNLWVFGGSTSGKFLGNDLWEYIPANNISKELPAAATPTLSMASGTYTSAQTVTITDSTNGAAIYYTTDGSAPTANSTEYDTPITVGSTETLSAIAIANGFNNSAVASATYTITLPPPSFSLTASSNSLTANAGSSASLNLTVAPQNGFIGTVTFECSGLPASATCSFTPSTVTPTGNNNSTTQLTITTTTSSGTAAPMEQHRYPLTVLSAALFLVGWRRNRRLRALIFTVAGCALLILTTACGSGGASYSTSGGSPTPTLATVTVTATSGTIQQSTKISLTIN